MNIQTQNQARQDCCSSITEGSCYFQNSTDSRHSALKTKALALSKEECLEQAVKEMRIGKRIHEELKRQGITVTWLASQLGLERSSLYYTFRQNSIDMDLLLRISCILNHNFVQDMADVFASFGLDGYATQDDSNPNPSLNC